MNAAYAMAANINRAFKEYGWTVRIRGVESGGEVINLPTHTFPTDDGGVDLKCPTEIAITDRREAELSKSGLISIIHRKNTDKAAFIGAQSVYKPKIYDKVGRDRGRQSVGAPSLHVRGVALRPLSQVHGARQDRLDQGKGRSSRRWLNEWITRIRRRRSRAIPARRSKAQLPLAAAKVTVVANEENPGYYSANFYLRPHFQLEGMDIGMSLVSRCRWRGSAAGRLRAGNAAESPQGRVWVRSVGEACDVPVLANA